MLQCRSMRPEGSAEELERRRRRAVSLVKEGYSQTKAAEMVGASQGSVSRWLKDLERNGSKALELKPHPGRPRILSEEQERELGDLLSKGARAHGWQNDLWTCPRVKALIERTFGVEYHVDHVRKILVYRLGWSAQKPETRARERKEEEIETWRMVEFPRLKKTPRGGERR
jgi:transposase